MTIGIPIKAIVLPTGRGVLQTLESMSAHRLIAAPVIMHKGSTAACLDVPERARVM